MSERYHRLFSSLASRGEGAFVPFTVLGDPDPTVSLEIVRTFVAAGADALELGIPFSDPVADGPVIQAADVRALEAGTRPHDVFSLIRAVRGEYPDIPIGLLIYANLVEGPGPDRFYGHAADAGVDSVLIADVPDVEAAPFCHHATEHGIDPVLIATTHCGDSHLERIARLGRGYTYVVTRTGPTGDEHEANLDLSDLVSRLGRLDAPPPVAGFGISTPEHVRQALRAGAAGAISGSALVRVVENHLDDVPSMLGRLSERVAILKGATAGSSPR